MSSGTEWLLRRLDGAQFERAAANSMMLSADCAHAVHPNYAGKHEVLLFDNSNCHINCL